LGRPADSGQEWDRRVRAAVPVGMPADSARAIMARNGFHCAPAAAERNAIWCDNHSASRMLVSRRWQAVIHSSGDRVATVKPSTGLIGP